MTTRSNGNIYIIADDDGLSVAADEASPNHKKKYSPREYGSALSSASGARRINLRFTKTSIIYKY